MKNSFFRP